MANKIIITGGAGQNNNLQAPEYDANQISLVNTDTIPTILTNNSVVEFHIFTSQNGSPIFSDYDYSNYDISSNDASISRIEVDVKRDIEEIDILTSYTNFSVLYNFFNNIGNTSRDSQLIIDAISADRTELILKGTFTNNTDFTNNIRDFIKYRDLTPGLRDFYLNLSDNNLLLCVNIDIDSTDTNNPLIFIKLYQPLPDNIERLQRLWIVQKIADSLVFNAEYYIEPTVDFTTRYLAGPNINLKQLDEVNSETVFLNKNELTGTTSSFFSNQISTLLSSSNININIDYSDFNNFINYSSPTIRLQNFFLKVSLLEEYQTTLNSLTGVPQNSGSINLFQSRINEILQNFDGYDRFLYYESGSKSWPKVNDSYPYTLASTGSIEVLEWYGSTNPESIYYGGELLSASRFDNDNKNYLLYSIPPYLRDDPQNAPYETFVSMIGQHFDNIWIYTKDITNKFNADNRINFGISKDLVSDAIKDFGIKLYQNNFNNSDIFSAFFGIPEDQNATGLPGVTFESLYYGLGTWGGSIYGPVPSGSEMVRTVISASNDIIPVDDINKRIYKRIYHNSPFLLKSKGTKRGLQALINCFGVPDTILQINEFGGKDKVRENDWDFYRRIYNKELISTGSGNQFTTFFANKGTPDTGLNSDWGVDPNVPRTVEFRFKSRTNPNTLPDCTGLTNTPIREELFILKDTDDLNTNSSSSLAITLEYFGSGSTTSSYSGSSFDPNNQYADLTLYVSGSTQYYSSSINLPFYNRDWWNVMLQYDSGSNKFNLNTSNKIYIGNDGTKLGFTGSTSITVPAYVDTLGYRNANLANTGFGGTNRFFGTGRSGSIKFSGSFQEHRYWTNLLSEEAFHNHVMNPLSIETGYLTGSLSPVETLAFRTREGEDWSITGSLTNPAYQSIHPKVTGSLTLTSSFTSRGLDSNIYNVNGLYQGNKEYQFLNQPIAGIKNRINDKIRVENLEFPEGNTLSVFRPLQQDNEASRSYTEHTNYLEVGFSPSNQVNDDIIAELGDINLGEYIGDPRHRSSSLDHYTDLNKLRDRYFEKYYENYNVKDFIRLIKYFDNSLFKMIKDFVPLRNSTSTGIIIKQHLLERNKYPQPKVDPFTTIAKTPSTGSTIKQTTDTGNNSRLIFKDTTIEGTLKSTVRGFITGSPIQVFSGSTGGIFNEFNNLNTSPYGALGTGPANRFYLTQSFSESISTISGSAIRLISNQDEFFNGEFSGSRIIVTTQSLNSHCDKFKKVNVQAGLVNYEYDRYIYLANTSSLNNFLLPGTSPRAGEVFFFKETFSNRISHLKISNITKGGDDLEDFLPNLTNITFDFVGTQQNINVNYIGAGQNSSTYEVVFPAYDYDSANFTSIFLNYSASAERTASLSDTTITRNQVQGGSPNFNYTIPITFDNETDPANLINTESGVYKPELANNRLLNYTASISGSYTFDTDLGFTSNYVGTFRLQNTTRNTTIDSLQFATSSNPGAPTTTQFNFNLQQLLSPSDSFLNGDEIKIEMNFDFSSNFGSQLGTGSLNISSSTFEINQKEVTYNTPVSTIIALEPAFISDNTDFLHAFDCQPLLNNAVNIRKGNLFINLDYSGQLFKPVNFLSVLSNSIDINTAEVQDSNYTTKAVVLPRYEGVKLSSARLNYYTDPGGLILSDGTVWGGDISFGKEPVIEQTKPNFGLFQLLVPTSPEIEFGTQVKLAYLIDKNGQPFKPVLNSPSFFNVQGTFETQNFIDIALDDTLQTNDTSLVNAAVGINLDNFNVSASVIRGAARVDPILTNQTQSVFKDNITNYFTESIRFTGDGIISDFHTFKADGPQLDQQLGQAFRMNITTDVFSNNCIINTTDNTIIFTSDSQSPVDITVKGVVDPFPTGGETNQSLAQFFQNTDIGRISLVRDPGDGSPSQTLDQRTFNIGGIDLNNNINQLRTGPINILNNDVFRVQVFLFGAQVDSRVNINMREMTIGGFQNFLPNSFASASFWTTGSLTSNWLTSSQALFTLYGKTQVQPETSDFKAINYPFTIKIGDQLRFEGDEDKSFTVVDVNTNSTSPATNTNLLVRVEPPMRPNINLDEFLLRRFNDDATSVLIDLTPPRFGFTTTTGIIKNITLNEEVGKNINNIMAGLVDRGTIPLQ